MPNEIEIEIINTLEKMIGLEIEWNTLLNKIPNKFIFQIFDWHYNVVTEFKREKEIFILAFRKNKKLIGLFPLRRVTKKIKHKKFKIIQPLTQGRADYQNFIISEDKEKCLSAFSNFLKSIYTDWNLIYLRSMPDVELNKLIINVLTEKNITTRKEDAFVCPIIKMEGTFDEYLKRNIKSKYLANLERLERNLHKIGEVSINRYDGEVDIEEIVNEFIRLHKKRWNLTDTKSKFNKEKECDYYRNLIKNLFKNGYLALFYIKINQRIIAIQLGTIYNNILLSHLNTYDPEFSKYGPGNLLIYHIIKRCHERNIALFDLLAGAEKYKYNWTNIETKTETLIAFKNKFSEFMFNAFYDKNRYSFLKKYKENI